MFLSPHQLCAGNQSMMGRSMRARVCVSKWMWKETSFQKRPACYNLGFCFFKCPCMFSAFSNGTKKFHYTCFSSLGGTCFSIFSVLFSFRARHHEASFPQGVEAWSAVELEFLSAFLAFSILHLKFYFYIHVCHVCALPRGPKEG